MDNTDEIWSKNVNDLDAAAKERASKKVIDKGGVPKTEKELDKMTD